MMIKSTVVASFVLMLLSGCATLNEAECTSADWRHIGEQDGNKGRLSSHLNRHRKACQKHGIAADSEQYYLGREQGLKRFCTPSRGYSLGLDGEEYQGVCSAEQAREFQSAYVKGLHLKESQLSIEYQQTSDELNTLRLERALLSTSGSNEERDEEIEKLISRRESLMSERLKLQRWVAQWSHP